MKERLLVSTRKGLFILQRATTGGWRIPAPAFVGVPVTFALEDPRTGAIYAALQHGHFGCKLHRSTNRGRTWSELAVPKYPKPPRRGALETTPDGKPWPWSLQLLWCLEIDPRTDGGLWCGTIPGGLFHSPDGGETWALQRSLWDRPERARWFGGGYDWPGVHSVCVDPRDPKRLTVGISCGGVWHSRDAGTTWELGGKGLRADYMPPESARDPVAQDPHRIVQCHADPDRLWMQHHNGIFVSRNAGRSWREIKTASPSAFGFAVAVHPGDPDVAWFVPAIKDECRVPVDGKLVVTRTSDGGKSFRALRSGLPQRAAYDLVFRHALDVSGDGRRLVFGSTTGAIFASENGGLRWECVSAHLPPVNAVRLQGADQTR